MAVLDAGGTVAAGEAIAAEPLAERVAGDAAGAELEPTLAMRHSDDCAAREELRDANRRGATDREIYAGKSADLLPLRVSVPISWGQNAVVPRLGRFCPYRPSIFALPGGSNFAVCQRCESLGERPAATATCSTLRPGKR